MRAEDVFLDADAAVARPLAGDLGRGDVDRGAAIAGEDDAAAGNQ